MFSKKALRFLRLWLDCHWNCVDLVSFWPFGKSFTSLSWKSWNRRGFGRLNAEHVLVDQFLQQLVPDVLVAWLVAMLPEQRGPLAEAWGPHITRCFYVHTVFHSTHRYPTPFQRFVMFSALAWWLLKPGMSWAAMTCFCWRLVYRMCVFCVFLPVGWVGVGWGGLITFNGTSTHTWCCATDLVSCTCTHTWCYATDLVSCTCTHTWCYATDGLGWSGVG